jgi:hypothetical protein
MAHIIAKDHRDLQALQAQFARNRNRQIASTRDVRHAHVCDDLGLVRRRVRKDGAHPDAKLRIVALRGIGLAIALTESQCSLTDGLENEDVQRATGGKVDRWLKPVR